MPGQHPGKCGENEARALPNLRQIHADWVAFRQDALEMAANVFGSENAMYGSDYPHAIGDPIGVPGAGGCTGGRRPQAGPGARRGAGVRVMTESGAAVDTA